jgi:WD40 repeat protein
MGQWSSAAIGIWEADSKVLSVAFSPDGTRIVSGCGDETIRVWDARTGDTVAGPFKGHTNWVRSVAFSPDDTRIVSGSDDHTIRVWDARTGDTVAEPFKGHTGFVCSIAFSPDGMRIVSGSYDHTIRVWDARTGDTVAGPFKGHTDSVASVAFSPDGTRIVSGSYDQTIQVWDADNASLSSHYLHSEPLSMDDFTFEQNGWITDASHKVLFFWISPNFRNQLPFPCNTLVIGPQGTTLIDYCGLCIGKTWSNCYLS